MKLQMKAQLTVDNLKVALAPLENIQGIRSLNSIISQMEGSSKITNSATILRNNRFELEFNFNSKEIIFNTTNSNQTINSEYINEMMLINQSRYEIEFVLKTLSSIVNELLNLPAGA